MERAERTLGRDVSTSIVLMDTPHPKKQASDKAARDLALSEDQKRIYEQLTIPAQEPNERLTEVVALSQSYAEARANILTPGPVDFDALVELDRDFTEQICKYEDLFQGNPQLIDFLYRSVRQVQDETRFEALKDPFAKLGYRLGLSQGREWNSERIDELHESVARLFDNIMQRNPDLFLRYGGKEISVDSANALSQAFVAVLRDGERRGIEKRIQADERAVSAGEVVGRLKQVWPFRLGVSVNKLIAQLEGLGNQDREHVDQAFQERQEQTLLEACNRTFKGMDRVVARQLLSGNDAAVQAFKVFDLLRGISRRRTRLRKAWEIYRNQDASALEAMESAFNKYFARSLGVRTLRQALAKRFRPDEAKYFTYRIKGEKSCADAYLLRSLIGGNKKDRYLAVQVVREYVESSTLTHLEKTYAEQFERTLHDDVCSRMKTSAQKDLVLAILERDGERTNAGIVKCAMEDNGNWVATPFLNEPPERRRELIDAYASVYHGSDVDKFWADLDEATARTDYGWLGRSERIRNLLREFPVLFRDSRPFVQSIVETGDLTEAELLRFFMEGIGTDAEGIRVVLQNQTPEDIERIRDEYASRYPSSAFIRKLAQWKWLEGHLLLGDLDHDLDAELSGDDQFDISVMMQGRVTDPHKIHSRLKERYAFEMSGPIMKFLVHCRQFRVRPTFARMERDMEAVSRFYEEKIEGVAEPREQDLIRYYTLSHFAQRSFDAYRKSKAFVTQIVSNSLAATGATLGALPGLILSSPYLVVAGGATLGSFFSRTTFARLVSGEAYGREEKFFDGVRALADGTTLMALRLGRLSAVTLSAIGRLFGASLGKGLLKSGVKMSLQRAVKSIEDRIKKQEKAKHIFSQIDGPSLYKDPVDRLADFHTAILDKAQDADPAPQYSAGVESAFREVMWRVLRAQAPHSNGTLFDGAS